MRFFHVNMHFFPNMHVRKKMHVDTDMQKFHVNMHLFPNMHFFPNIHITTRPRLAYPLRCSRTVYEHAIADHVALSLVLDELEQLHLDRLGVFPRRDADAKQLHCLHYLGPVKGPQHHSCYRWHRRCHAAPPSAGSARSLSPPSPSAVCLC
jgi:hypothetical protein